MNLKSFLPSFRRTIKRIFRWVARTLLSLLPVKVNHWLRKLRDSYYVSRSPARTILVNKILPTLSSPKLELFGSVAVARRDDTPV